MNDDNKDKIIARQREQLKILSGKIAALEQEIALLKYEKKLKKQTVL